MLRKIYTINAKVNKYKDKDAIKYAEALAEQLAEILKLRRCDDVKVKAYYCKYFAK
jgi:hypothetical protein